MLSMCFTVDTYSHVASVCRYPHVSAAIHELYVTQCELQLPVPKCLISAEVMQDILTGLWLLQQLPEHAGHPT